MDKEAYVSCDEVGFGGTEVARSDKRFFALASVALSDAEAAAVIAAACDKHAIQLPELQAWPLFGLPGGQALITDIVTACEGRFAVTLHDKLYVLCGELWDFLFRPVLGPAFELLYEKEMNVTVTELAHEWMLARPAESGRVIEEFLKYRASLDPADAPSWFAEVPGNRGIDAFAHPFEHVLQFARDHRETIAAENVRFWTEGPKSPPWAIPHTENCYWAHMNHWGGDGRPLVVRCRDGEPLRTIVNMVVGEGEYDPGIIVPPRSEGGRPAWLETPRPSFVSSRGHRAVQLANVIAGATVGQVNGQLEFDLDGLFTDLARHTRGARLFSKGADHLRAEDGVADVNVGVLRSLSHLAKQRLDLPRRIEEAYRRAECGGAGG